MKAEILKNKLDEAIAHLNNALAEVEATNEALRGTGMRIIDISMNQRSALCGSYAAKPLTEIFPHVDNVSPWKLSQRFTATYSDWEFRQVWSDEYENTRYEEDAETV